MKKYFLILMMLLSIVFIPGVKAFSGGVNTSCENNGTCLLLCNYENNLYVSNKKTSKYKERISIYYFYKNQKYDIYWTVNTKNIYNKGKKSFVNTFGSSGKNVYLAGGLSLKESNFRCPTYGYVDKGAYSGNELCFDNDGYSCAREHNDTNTKFGTASDLFINSVKDQDIYEEIDYYYKNSSYRDLKCEEIFDFANPGSPKLLLTKEKFNEDMWKDFDENFLHGNKAPSFIDNYNILIK